MSTLSSPPPRPEVLPFYPAGVPPLLASLPRWVVWRHDLVGGSWRKVLYQCVPGGRPRRARTNDPSTWTSYDRTLDYLASSGVDWAGPGFVFGPGDGLCGVDLDRCRDPISGQLTRHALTVLAALYTYAEVSPSGTGVKCISLAHKPPGARCTFRGAGASVECYGAGRYFALTGRRLAWLPPEVRPRQRALEALHARDFLVPGLRGGAAEEQAAGGARPRAPLVSPAGDGGRAAARPPHSNPVRRAAAYLARVEPAVSGCGGHDRTFAAACLLVHGFGLGRDEALALLAEYSRRCLPPWSHSELLHKVQSAAEKGTYRDLLGNAGGYVR